MVNFGIVIKYDGLEISKNNRDNAAIFSKNLKT